MIALSTLLWTSAKPIIKSLILGGCGALMARHGMLTPAGSKVVSGLILNYTLPALLFAKMLSCVSLENISELGLVAVVAILYMVMGALFGVLIQMTGRVPKRLHRGIIAAAMFTNFGDLPISIILAVSDHPPFLVGDGALGTAYSSVFIAVFYLFLFPFGGYGLIRYDHVKEAQRLRSLTNALSEQSTETSDTTVSSSDLSSPLSSSSSPISPSTSSPEGTSSDATMSNDTLGGSSSIAATLHPRQQSPVKEFSDSKANQSMWSNSPTRIMPIYPHQTLRPLHSLPPTTISRASTIINLEPGDKMDAPEVGFDNEIEPPTSRDPEDYLARREEDRVDTMDQGGQSTNLFGNTHHLTPETQGLQVSGKRQSVGSSMSASSAKTKVDSAGSDSSATQNATALLPMPENDITEGAIGQLDLEETSSCRRRTSLHLQMEDYSTEKVKKKSVNIRATTFPESTPARQKARQSSLPPPPTPLPPSVSGSQLQVEQEQQQEVESLSHSPLPKVPPQLERTYTARTVDRSLFWRLFHGTREYLTPPTIGLLLGLVVALTPLRRLFIVTSSPLPSLDELPPLSFIHEITLMLGGCCVPLGLTVLGASLSRLKPVRIRPLVPALAMITIVKMVISPLIGILLVQMVLVRYFGWIKAQSHMLQFTLMLMSGSPTSITCFVLALVWDRRTRNAGSEMAALIAVPVRGGVGAVDGAERVYDLLFILK